MTPTPAVDRGSPDAAARVDAACREADVLQVVGRGMPKDVVDRVLAATDALFALPLEAPRHPPVLAEGHLLARLVGPRPGAASQAVPTPGGRCV